jgi:hypothetical protein
LMIWETDVDINVAAKRQWIKDVEIKDWIN